MNKSIIQYAKMRAEQIRKEQLKVQSLSSSFLNDESLSSALDSILSAANKLKKA